MGPRSLNLVECESIAHDFLAAAGMTDEVYAGPPTTLARLGISTSSRAPSACEGIFGADDAVVRVRNRGPLPNRHRAAGHECSHLAQLLAGVPWPHHEPSTDLVGTMLQMPRRGVLRVIREAGYDLRALEAHYPLVWPSQRLIRIALAVGTVAVICTGRSHTIVANDDASWPLDWEMRAHALCDAAHYRGRLLGDLEGGLAVPFHDPDQRRGVVVLFPQRGQAY